MRRPALVLVVLTMIGTACGSTSEAQLQSEPTDSIRATASPRVGDTTISIARTTTLAPSTSQVMTTVGPTEVPEQTIYRPEPIREGDQVTAVIGPVAGVVLDNSSVKLRIVVLPDGRFIEADLTSAVVPEGAAFWVTEINGRLRGKVTARQGSTWGIRVDRDVYGDSFTVTFSATTTNGELVASTGDVQMTE